MNTDGHRWTQMGRTLRTLRTMITRSCSPDRLGASDGLAERCRVRARGKGNHKGHGEREGEEGSDLCMFVLFASCLCPPAEGAAGASEGTVGSVGSDGSGGWD